MDADTSTNLVELTIEAIASGGDGMARQASGRVVFVPRTAPGDRVLVELTERRRRWARGHVVELSAAGPDRTEATCAHYDTCGGCAIQHLEADAQTSALERAVADALGRIGGLDLPISPITPSPKRFEYRNRVTFTLRRRKGRAFAGYHQPRGRGITDVDVCPLAEPAISEAWSGLREHWNNSAPHLPAGRELRITLRANAAGGTALWITGGMGSGRPGVVAEAIPSLESYWWRPHGRERQRLGGARHFSDTWGGFELALRPEAFLQVNRGIARAIDEHVMAGLGSLEGRRILDLYGGVGLRARAWAEAGAEVTLVESNPDAVASARSLGTGVPGLDIRAATVESTLDELGSADAVVVNPPRAGLSRDVAAALAEHGAQTLIYVSCDPATLARDVVRLGDRWEAVEAKPFDAFPQTGHVETVLTMRAR